MHDPEEERADGGPYFVRSPADMYKLFPDYADAVAEQEIADGVDINSTSRIALPVFTHRNFSNTGPVPAQLYARRA